MYTMHTLLCDISRSWEKDRSGRFVGFRGCLLSCGTHFRFAYYRTRSNPAEWKTQGLPNSAVH